MAAISEEQLVREMENEGDGQCISDRAIALSIAHSLLRLARAAEHLEDLARKSLTEVENVG